MHTALAASAVLALTATVASAATLPEPIRWNLRARIIEVNGTPPAGALENLGADWTVDIEATVVATTPEPDPGVPFGEHRRRLILDNRFTIDFRPASGGPDGYRFTGDGADVNGAYLPRNTAPSDSADYSLTGLPILAERGAEPEGTIEVVFGFFGDDGLLAHEDDFVARPDLARALGTGFFVYFENGAFARGEIVEWASLPVPAPGAVSLFGLASLAVLRRRRA